MMTRRALLASLAAAFALDPERALWVPGRKLISVPAVPELVPWQINIINWYKADLLFTGDSIRFVGEKGYTTFGEEPTGPLSQIQWDVEKVRQVQLGEHDYTRTSLTAMIPKDCIGLVQRLNLL